jgi:hypothetical protein
MEFGCFLRALVFIALCAMVHCQFANLNLAVQSVSTYPTCQESPLADPDLDTAAFVDENTPPGDQPSGVTPCQQIGNTSVTVVRLNLKVNRIKGTDNLVFTLHNLVSPEQARNYDPSQPCSGVPNGEDCRLLKDVFVVSFDTTVMMASYDLKPRASTIPYAVFSMFSDNKLLNKTYGSALSYVDTIDCTYDQDWYDTYTPLNNPASYGNLAGLSGVCPAADGLKDPLWKPFYSEPTGSTSNEKCTYLNCRRQKKSGSSRPPWRTITMVPIQPDCTIFDIQERPRALMNARATLTGAMGNQSLVLSTLRGSSVQSIPGLVYMRIVRPTLGTGLVGDNIGGAIVTCFTATTNASNVLNVPGAVNDFAEDDEFEVFNPWAKANGVDLRGLKGCVAPAAECRRRIGGRPRDAFWYYVDPFRLIRTYGDTCNTNGIPQSIYNSPGVRALVCTNVESNPDTCVPGYKQVVDDQFAFTPCQVSQLQAKMIAEYAATDKTSGFDFVTPNFQPTRPACAVKGESLLCDALGGSSDLVGLDIIMYFPGTLLGEVVTVSNGKLLNASCAGAEGGSGAVPFVILNTGKLNGRYKVVVTFTVASPLVTSVNPASAEASIDILPGRTGQSNVDFSYTGVLGKGGLFAKVDLYELFTSTLLQSANLDCTILQGIKASEVIGDSDETKAPLPKPCAFINLFCWSGVGFLGILGRLFVAIVFFGAIFTVVGSLLYGMTTQTVAFRAQTQSYKAQAKQRRAQQEVDDERTAKRAQEFAANASRARGNVAITE